VQHRLRRAGCLGCWLCNPEKLSS